MRGRNRATRDASLSIVPAAEEVLRAIAASELPTIWWDESARATNQQPIRFRPRELANALVLASARIRALEAQLATLREVGSPK